MVKVKIVLFMLTIITIKFIFIAINDIGDKKLNIMKELINFTDYLRIYSCDLKMSLEEILLRFNFKSDKTKIICNRLFEEIKSTAKSERKNNIFSSFINEFAMTPHDFNAVFSEIISYYGSTYSDVLEHKLNLTIKDMEKNMKEFEKKHVEKKNLYNKVSILFGCLTAVILV